MRWPWGSVALPLLARLYIRKVDLPKIRVEGRPEFRTKLVMAVELLTWAKKWLGWLKLPIWRWPTGRMPRGTSSSRPWPWA